MPISPFKSLPTASHLYAIDTLLSHHPTPDPPRSIHQWNRRAFFRHPRCRTTKYRGLVVIWSATPFPATSPISTQVSPGSPTDLCIVSGITCRTGVSRSPTSYLSSDVQTLPPSYSSCDKQILPARAYDRSQRMDPRRLSSNDSQSVWPPYARHRQGCP